MLVFFTVSSTLRSLRSELKATECEKPSLLHRELTQLLKGAGELGNTLILLRLCCARGEEVREHVHAYW